MVTEQNEALPINCSYICTELLLSCNAVQSIPAYIYGRTAGSVLTGTFWGRNRLTTKEGGGGGSYQVTKVRVMLHISCVGNTMCNNQQHSNKYTAIAIGLYTLIFMWK